jgi:hypothetical protein
MSIFKKIKRALLFPLIGIVFAASTLNPTSSVYAEPAIEQPQAQTQTQTQTGQTTTQTTGTTTTTQSGATIQAGNDTCYNQIEGIGWAICPLMNFLSNSVDKIYNTVQDLLIIDPVDMSEKSPILKVWEYVRNITNIVFILVLLVIIYSQITGFGISNYGIKKLLPRLIISAILVNISHIICILAIDVSNVIGTSLSNFLGGIPQSLVDSGAATASVATPSFYDVFSAVATGATLTIAGGAVISALSGGVGALLLAFIPVVFGALIAVIIGLLTISLRQSVIILLLTIAPLAFVAFILPNTEGYFRKWKELFFQMIFFYPMFSFLFGVSRLASWILFASSTTMLGVILSLALQVIPLFLAVSMLKMSKSVLGKVSDKLDNIGSKATNKVKGFSDSRGDLARRKHLARGMKQPFNLLSGASWRAATEKSNRKVSWQAKQTEGIIDSLANEDMNALRRNERIIGYKKDGTPIYSQRAGRKRANKYSSLEAEARDYALRGKGDDLKTENYYSTLKDAYESAGITKGDAYTHASNMGKNYFELRKQMNAQKLNDEADNRAWEEAVIEASKRYVQGPNKGKLINQAAYDDLIIGSLGASGYASNLATAKGRAQAEVDAAKVIGDAYSLANARRAANVKSYQTYMDSRVTADVLRQYHEFIKTGDVDGMVAAHNVLARRGDYDQIGKGLIEYFKNGQDLGSDAVNTIALNLLPMKDADPTLGRFGKFLNMETWQYTDGKRKARVDVEQFVTGKAEKLDGSVHETKININSGLNGTRLDKIDRTAFNTLAAFTDEVFTPTKSGSVDQAIRKYRDLNKVLCPQEITAIPTYASGSEQMYAAVGKITGQKKENGKWVDKWEKEKISAEEKLVRRTASDIDVYEHLRSFTLKDIIMMKSDDFEGIQSHIMNTIRADNAQKKITMTEEQVKNKANQIIRGELEDRLLKVGGSNFKLDEMKEAIYNALRIDIYRDQAALAKGKPSTEQWLSVKGYNSTDQYSARKLQDEKRAAADDNKRKNI